MNKIKQLQTLIGVVADGIWGPKSKAALEALISSANNEPAAPVLTTQQNDAGGLVDARSEKNIATLHPKLQPLARKLIQQASDKEMRFKITSGTRSFEAQAELRKTYEAGGPVAARAGLSMHNYGLAFDVTEFRGSLPKYESPNYKLIGQLGKSDGLNWGGDWTGKGTDEPHFELHPLWSKSMTANEMMAELRQRHDNRQDVFD